MSLEILFEDNHLICINKEAGVLTQPARGQSVCLLNLVKEHIKMRVNKPGNVFLGMVQRLDKPVSGVIVFAKTSKAASRLSASIRDRELSKFYLAITETRPGQQSASGWREYRHHLKREFDTTVVCSERDEQAQLGALRLKTLYSGEQRCCHLVQLLTGRKHQIRAQLAHLGWPILGDGKYGSQQPFAGTGIALHSFCLGLVHPVRREEMLVLAAPGPTFFSDFSTSQVERIRLHAERELKLC